MPSRLRGEVCRRVGVSAYRRLGNKTAFRNGYIDQKVSTKLMTLCKRPPADPPIRFPVALIRRREPAG